jgi:hypothetical protein
MLLFLTVAFSILFETDASLAREKAAKRIEA